MESFGFRLLPKSKTLGTGLFLIASQIEWYKLHSHRAYQCFVYRDTYVTAEILYWPMCFQ